MTDSDDDIIEDINEETDKMGQDDLSLNEPEHDELQPEYKSTTRGYTLRVKFMRILLPLIAVAILGTLIALPFYSDAPIIRKHKEHPTATDKSSSEPVITDEKKALQMTSPRFDGLDSKGRPFTIIAKKVMQDEGEANADMTLQNPIADIQLNPKESLAVTAQTGLYKQKEQSIDLTGDVTMFHDNGYSLSSDTMHIDVQTGHANTTDPTYLRGADGNIDGKGGFEINDFGDHIIFKGPAKLLLYKTGKEQ